MPTLALTVPAVAGLHQLTAVPQASQSVHLTEYQASASGDTGQAGLASLAALAAAPSAPWVTNTRIAGATPFAWAGNLFGLPGAPLLWNQGNAVNTYLDACYNLDGPELPYLVAWTPAQVKGIGSWLAGVQAGTSQWSDNRVTAATVLDARVYKWASGVRSLDGAAADTTTNRLYRTTEGGVRGDGVAAGFRAFPVVTGGDFTILVKLRRTSAAAGGYFGPSWSASARVRADGAGSFNYFDDVIGGGEINIITGTSTNTWYTIALKKENGVLYVRGSGGAWITYGACGGSSAVLGGFNFSPSGDVMTAATQIGDAAFVFRAINDTELALFNTYWGT